MLIKLQFIFTDAKRNILSNHSLKLKSTESKKTNYSSFGPLYKIFRNSIKFLQLGLPYSVRKLLAQNGTSERGFLKISHSRVVRCNKFIRVIHFSNLNKNRIMRKRRSQNMTHILLGCPVLLVSQQQ